MSIHGVTMPIQLSKASSMTTNPKDDSVKAVKAELPEAAPEGTWMAQVANEPDMGERLDKWVAGWTGLSRGRVLELIGNGDVRAEGNIVTKPSVKILPGMEYAVFVPPPRDDIPKPENIPLDILFEDDWLIVVNKPIGMTVHPAPGSRTGTLVHALLYHCKDTLSGIGGVMRPGIVHRIDKDTSGVMVVAKNDHAHRYLSKQFAKHTIERLYICFTRSGPKPRVGRIESRLARSQHDRKKITVVRGTFGDIEASEHGRHAVTHYEQVQGYGQQPHAAVGTPQVSRIECRLETGRTHQIRVHLAHIGCPLLGDQLYGKQRAFLTTKDPNELAVREALSGFKRQALHAARLGFKHPGTKEEMVFESEMPEDMLALQRTFAGLDKDT